MKWSIFFSILFFLGAFYARSQNDIPESKSIVFDKKSDDKTKLNHILQLVDYYKSNGQYDSTMYFLNLGLNLSKKNKNLTSYELDITNKKGWIYYMTNHFYEAINNFKKACKISEETKNDYYLASSYLNLAGVYVHLNELDQAQHYIDEVIERIDELNSNDQASIYGIQGQVFYAKDDYKRAMKSYHYARKIAIKNNVYYGNIDIELGVTSDHLKRLDSAIFYLESGYELSSEHPAQRAEAAIELAKIYSENDNFKSAIDLLLEAIDIAKQIGNYDNIKESASLLLALKEHLDKNYNIKELNELYEESLDSVYSQSETQDFFKNEYKIKVQESEARAKELKLKQEIKRREVESDFERKQIIIIVIFSLVILSLIVVYKFKVRSNKYDQNLLLKEISLLKKNLATRSFVSDTVSSEQKIKLDRHKIEHELDTKLNETDWNILCELVENPSINNKELANNISLSYEGVRSSLKKLYTLFDLRKDSGKNVRMELIIRALRCSQA